MRQRKVTKILGRRSDMGEGEKGAISIHLFASTLPELPWAASAEGLTSFAKTPHRAVDCLLEGLAKTDRARGEG